MANLIAKMALREWTPPPSKTASAIKFPAFLHFSVVGIYAKAFGDQSRCLSIMWFLAWNLCSWNVLIFLLDVERFIFPTCGDSTVNLWAQNGICHIAFVSWASEGESICYWHHSPRRQMILWIWSLKVPNTKWCMKLDGSCGMALWCEVCCCQLLK